MVEPPRQATKIALDLKKHLVDHNLLEVKQASAPVWARGVESGGVGGAGECRGWWTTRSLLAA